MPDILVLLLEQVTVFSSVTAAILIAVKKLFKCRIPPRIGMALWIVLLARLVCPVFPESRISVYNYIPASRDLLYAMQKTDDPLPAEETPLSDNPYVLTETPVTPEAEEPPAERTDAGDKTVGGYLSDGTAGAGERINRIVASVYLCGVGISLGISFAVYETAKRRALRDTIPAEDERLLALYRETAEEMGLNPKRLPRLLFGPTTMLAGLTRPAVICRESDLSGEGWGGASLSRPAAAKAADRAARMVFAHELTHYRYGDNPLLVFSTFVNCLFWFNPLLWAVRHMLREDVEVLCDARTLEFCGIPGTEYALMLCRESAFDALSGGLAAEAGCHMSRRGRHLKTRLLTISHLKHRRFLPKAASWLLCAAIISVCLTNPILSRSGEYGSYIDRYASVSGADRAELRRQETATVSEYLGAVSLLLRISTGGESSLPSSIEQLKRSVAAISQDASPGASVMWLNRELGNYKADEVLTVRSAAAVNEAALAVLHVGMGENEADTVLPAMISEEAMDRVLNGLTEEEGDLLLCAYNRGVPGAKVRFEAFYTGDMMELILSRIRDEWAREKFRGFYHEISLTPENRASFSEELSTAVSERWDVKSVFVRDPGLTRVEEGTLTKILAAAHAGERSDVWYRKDVEDGVSFETAAALLEKGGFTPLDALKDAAWIGEFSGDPAVAVSAVRPGLRDSGILYDSVGLSRSEELYRMLDRGYRLGLTEASGGELDPARKLSAGEGIASAYRLLAAILAD
ncbi:MAG: M56 family metallopeptidase [Clostridia bacterium]|nr:M56 family metallopeptidase [Clostridia bacterium]